MIRYAATDSWVWDENREAVCFEVVANGRILTCIVAKDCIDDHMGRPASGCDRLDAARARSREIIDKMTQRLALGRVGEDDTIVLRAVDW